MSLKVWDVGCMNPSCGFIAKDQLFASWEADTGQCPHCHSPLQKLATIRRSVATAWHPSSRVVLFKHPGTGDIKYPGRNDTPMPDRYRQQGYERVEMASLAEVTRHEKETGTLCEAMHWDSNGKTFSQPDNEGTYAPKIERSNLLDD